MKFIIGLALLTVATFGGAFTAQTQHFDQEKLACKRAEGRGSIRYTRAGIPFAYECMRMHLVLKYKNGEYR